MHLQFLLLPPEERRLYFEQVAQRRSLSPVIVEKDFWVCWLLALLFSSRNGDVLVFKGGTSLSKVFGVIARFSEDIDLSVSPEFLNLPDIERLPQVSRNRANQWMKEAEAKCAMAVHREIQPELERAVTAILGPSETAWFEFLTDSATNSPVLLFHYPTTQPPGLKYLNRAVKLEFGSLTDQRPAGRHTVRPWLVEEIPQAFADWQCEVVALELERSFWEKATILHAEHHRPPDRPTPNRFSRHYADMAALALHPIASHAIEWVDLRDRVVQWKSRFFGSGWARYDLARPGTFRLVPPPSRLSTLRLDYDAMREMYLTAPIGFDLIMNTLADLEAQINGVG
jgi:hypothetical protein